MNISVFGLGYVGAVTAACLARDGHQVTGVDLAQGKVDTMNCGQSPIVEEAVEDLIAAAVAAGRLRATTSAEDAMSEADLAVVCVGTPSRANGSLETAHVEAVTREIGTALRARRGRSARPLLFVLRSTVLPGTVRDLVLPVLAESSAIVPGDGYDVVFHPEFLREGSSVCDYDDPPKIVLGERVPGCGAALEAIYEGFSAPCFRVPLEVAETVKYADNLFHALKITFANEIGHFCASRGVDAHAVMDVFRADTKLNISPRYLRPGFAFGGSCLPKDLRAFLHAARSADVGLPMLEGILPSNRARIERAADRILASGARSVGLHGLAFKPGTDDLRESPYVALAERLLGKGLQLRIFDPLVRYAQLSGHNKDFIDRAIPHLADSLVRSLGDLRSCDLVFASHPLPPAFAASLRADGLAVVDPDSEAST